MLSKTENDLIIKHLPLVKNIANKYRAGLIHIEYDDLVQAGSIGLMTALQNFDESLGYKFSTFAYPYIEGHIINELRDNNLMIYVSYQMQHKVFEYKEQHNLTGITMLDFTTENGINPKLFLSALSAMRPIISIDEPIAHSSEYISLHEILADNDTSVETTQLIRDMKNHIDELFNYYKLTDDQKTCLKLYYGFDDNPKTYREISEILNLSPSRIQQIIAKGLRFMRLCEYYNNREGKEYLDIFNNINIDKFI